jgi:hypothetical protein
MKHLKMFGLAAVAAVAMMAVVGAGTAPATVICKNNLNTEKCSEPYPAGTKGKASLEAGTTAVLETLGGSVLITCTESVVESSLEQPGSSVSTVKSAVSTITFAKCNQTVIVLKPGYAELHWIKGTDNGTLTTIGTEVTVTTIFGSCTYGTGLGLDAGTTVGGNPGSMMLSVVVPKVAGGFACPTEARVTGKYVATSPTNAWVAAG